jgi:hypothetical protein
VKVPFQKIQLILGHPVRLLWKCFDELPFLSVVYLLSCKEMLEHAEFFFIPLNQPQEICAHIRAQGGESIQMKSTVSI